MSAATKAGRGSGGGTGCGPEGGAPAAESGSIAYMARNSVAANICMAILIVGGLLMLPGIKQEVFPEFDLEIVTVSVVYPGASPAEVEQGAVLAIEEAVRGIDGVKKVISTSAEGGGTVAVELQEDAVIQRALGDIESAVDRITSFAADVERPVVSLVSLRREVLNLAVYGDVEERSLRELAEELRDEILQDPRITVVELSGVRPFEISVEIPQETLRRFDLTLEGVARRIRETSVELPAGGVKTRQGEILLRTDERRDRGSELRDVLLRSNDQGAELRLSDVAEIRDAFQDTDQEAYFDGRRAALLKCYRIGDQTPQTVSAAVHEFIERRAPTLPPAVKLAVLDDRSEVYEDRVDLLLRNARLGFFLVLGILGLLLDIRLAFWITLGIPISFCGSLILMAWLDVSLNMISLFAFILTLGIVVDDAIVVGEAIYHRREQGLGPFRAAIEGTRDVATPVTFSVLTTLIAFTPLLFVPGVMGKIMKVMPMVVISILAISLFESLYVLPAHLAHANLERPRGPFGYIHALQQGVAWLLDVFIRRVYGPALDLLMRGRWISMAIALVGLIVTVGLVAGKRIGIIFFPRIDADRVIATATLPYGASVDRTREVADRLEETAVEVLGRYGERGSMDEGIYTLVGGTRARGPAGTGGNAGSHLAQVIVWLVPMDQRPIGAGEYAREWREEVGAIPGLESLKFQSTGGPGQGDDINVELSHASTEVLDEACQDLAASLATYAGVHEIDDGVADGKVQLNLRLTREGRAWGFSQVDLARAVRSAFFGQEALRQQRGRNEVRTYVRLPEEERASEQDISGFLLLTEQGREIRLSDAAEVERSRAYKQITRRDGRRVQAVTAVVDEERVNVTQVLGEIQEDVLPELVQRYPGLSWGYTGPEEDRKESVEALKRNFVVALIAMFALMAVAFGSYAQPLLIMVTIPFGLVGAIWGHVFWGLEISLMSMFGLVALSGVVVNDSLVLIDAMNRNLEQGMTPLDAVTTGGMRRFRPILLTSLTTFLGLLPMMMETSMQARFLIPMAVSLGFGVLFATVITLVIVPAAYLILEDVRAAIGWLWGWVSWLLDPDPDAGAAGGVESV